MKQISLQLPEIKLFEQDPFGYKYTSSDHYGAYIVLANYAGVNNPNPRIPVYWAHGCSGPWENADPYFLTGSFKKSAPYFLARKDQVDCLKQHGYKNGKAIGLPVLYLEPRNYRRIEGSLLIMPPHVLSGMRHEKNDVYQNYIDFIRPYLSGFNYVAVCLHASCLREGLWVKEFSELGIDIIEGAQYNDANALYRQEALFKQFETVTTSDWGSHVAYALYWGAKVSICGPKPLVQFEDYIRCDGFWAKHPKLLELFLSKKIEEERVHFLRSFFIHPSEAVADVELGKFLVGYRHQCSSDEIKQLFFSKNFMHSLSYFFWNMETYFTAYYWRRLYKKTKSFVWKRFFK